MLPTINLLKMDPVEVSPAGPAGTGFYRPGNQFKASFGTVMDNQAGTDPATAFVLQDEILPPDGNELPASPVAGGNPQDMLPFLAVAESAPADPMANNQIVTIAAAGGKQAELPVEAEETETELPPIPGAALPEIPDLAPVAIDVSTAVAQPGKGMPVPVDLIPTMRTRDLVTTIPSQPSGQNPDSRALATGAELVATQAVGTATTALAPDHASAARLVDIAQYNVSVSANTSGTMADSADLLQKKVGVAAANPTVTTVDSLVSLPVTGDTSRAAPAPLVQTSIGLPVQDQRWGEAVSEKVLWMAGQSIQKAEIRLNPAELGPIRVEISMTDDAATVTFSAQHALTREAIDAALPRLKEMLGDNGISLANTDVADADVRHERHAGENDGMPASAGEGDGQEDVDQVSTTRLPTRAVSALVDTFA